MVNKKYLTAFLFYILIITVNGQSVINTNIKEKPIYRVFYEHEHLRDTTKPDKVYKQNMVLLVGDKHSEFVSFNKLIEFRDTEKGMFSEFRSGNTNVKITPGKINIPEEIILSYTSNDAIINTYMAHYCHYTDILPEIKWEIRDTTKLIEGIECMLANTTYLGRTWEAWFTLSIPISTGPWFLRGLPGIILEAQDSKAEVLYKFVRIETATIANEVIDYQKDKYKFISLTNKEKNEKYSKLEYFKQLDLARKDRAAYFRYISEKYDFNIYGTLINYGLTNHFSWSSIIPNPINLANK